MSNLPAPPQETSMVSPEQGVAGGTDYIITPIWFQTFTSWLARLGQGAQVLDVTTLTAQTASIGTTPIPLPSVAEGMYRISYYMRVTTAASINSSLTFTVSWPESGVTLTASGAAMTGNTTTTIQTGTITMEVDSLGPISYSTTYASAGTAMAYSLRIVTEVLA